MSFYSVLFLFHVLHASSAKLADYISPCSAKDPNLDDCILKQTKKLYPSLVKEKTNWMLSDHFKAIEKSVKIKGRSLAVSGIKEFDIPSLEPLHVPFMELEESRGGAIGFTFNITNAKHIGWKNTNYTSAKVDLKKWNFKMEAKTSVFSVLGDYQVSGRILVLPISGNGFSNITMVQSTFHLEFDGAPEARGGTTYLKITSCKLSFEHQKAIIRLDNLFNNKELSDTMNRVLNENSKEVFGELKSGLEDIFEKISLSLLSRFFAKIPLDQMIKDLDLN